MQLVVENKIKFSKLIQPYVRWAPSPLKPEVKQSTVCNTPYTDAYIAGSDWDFLGRNAHSYPTQLHQKIPRETVFPPHPIPLVKRCTSSPKQSQSIITPPSLHPSSLTSFYNELCSLLT